MGKCFFARYYTRVLIRVLRKMKSRYTLWTIVVIFIAFAVLNQSVKGTLTCIAWALVSSTIYILIYTLSLVNENYSLYKILDKKGFCIEYLHAYEQKYITDKPLNNHDALEYAEIIMRIGKPDEAIKYLNTLTLPPNADIWFQSKYFFLYVLSALKIGNLAIAEDMWNRSEDLISKISTDSGLCAKGGAMVIIAMILTDCFAAQQNGDKTRLERAFQQTEDMLINPQITDKTLLQIMRLYELRELGFTERYNELLPGVREEINASKPLVRYYKNLLLENLSRVENGMLPFQPLDDRL